LLAKPDFFDDSPLAMHLTAVEVAVEVAPNNGFTINIEERPTVRANIVPEKG
jgi:hypothetical protein